MITLGQFDPTPAAELIYAHFPRYRDEFEKITAAAQSVSDIFPYRRKKRFVSQPDEGTDA